MYIVKVPGVNGLGKTRGCERAGNAIIDTLKDIHSNEQGVPIDVNLLELEEIHLNKGNLEEANDLIYKNSLESFEAKPKIVFLGGDHSVSYSSVCAFNNYCNKYDKEQCLIVFDAHADCMKPMREPTHEEWLRGVIEYGEFPPENILLVGVRNMEKNEIAFLKEKGIRTISMNQFLLELEDTCDIIMEFVQGRELYVSIDIDVLDPSCAPATGYPVPGGFTSRQFLYLVSRLNKIKTLRAVDIVEINPEKDKEFDNRTVWLAAKVLAELL